MGIKTEGQFILFRFYKHSEKPPHHMGIKTPLRTDTPKILALKNLPTTWGLRLSILGIYINIVFPLKNLPTTWGLRRLLRLPMHRATFL